MGSFQGEEGARSRTQEEHHHRSLVDDPCHVELLAPLDSQMATFLEEVVDFQSLEERRSHSRHSHATGIHCIQMEVRAGTDVVADTVAVAGIDFDESCCCHTERAPREGEEVGKTMREEGPMSPRGEVEVALKRNTTHHQ